MPICLAGLPQIIMTRLRQGQIVELPNRYELSQVK
jgi:hypothetical protein